MLSLFNVPVYTLIGHEFLQKHHLNEALIEYRKAVSPPQKVALSNSLDRARCQRLYCMERTWYHLSYIKTTS